MGDHAGVEDLECVGALHAGAMDGFFEREKVDNSGPALQGRRERQAA
jgi:hypothetical protein